MIKHSFFAKNALILGTLGGALFVSNVWADFTVKGSSGEPTATANSQITVTGHTIEPGDDKIAIYVQKLNSTYGVGINYYAYTGGTASNEAYLSFGPGTYQIKTWGCKTTKATNQIMCRQISSDNATVVNSDPADHLWLNPSGNMETQSPEIVDLARTITAGARSDREKSQAIHDWVATNIKYDLAAFKTRTDIETPIDALAVYRGRLAVCEGISYLTAALHRAVGIRAKVIEGTGLTGDTPPTASGPNNHGWNEVYFDNHWAIVDVTWDMGGEMPDGTFKYELVQGFFDPTPDYFAKTHFKKTEMAE